MSFELAWPNRPHRVRFKKAVRVVPLIDGPPRAFRVLSGNLSRSGMFLASPEPFLEGTKIALSIEAGGRVLPFAQGEVMWRQLATGSGVPGKPCGGAGFGVRFTNFLHPRAHELVEYLVDNLDTGRPLALPKRRRWKRVALYAAAAAASVLFIAFGMKLARNITFEAPAPEAIVEAEAVEAQTPPEPVAILPAAPAPAPAPDPVIAKAEPPEPDLPSLPPATPVFAAAVPQAVKQEVAALSSAGLLPMPKCGASSLRWEQRGDRTEIEVAPADGARFAAAFRMKNPDRLVIDLSGREPKKSHLVKATEIPNVTALRIGKRKAGGTRLVLDLLKPATLKVDGSKLQLTY